MVSPYLSNSWTCFWLRRVFKKLDGDHWAVHVVTGNLRRKFVDVDHRFAHEDHVVDSADLILLTVPCPLLSLLEGLEEVALEHRAAHGNVREEHVSSVSVLALLVACLLLGLCGPR